MPDHQVAIHYARPVPPLGPGELGTPDGYFARCSCEWTGPLRSGDVQTGPIRAKMDADQHLRQAELVERTETHDA